MQTNLLVRDIIDIYLYTGCLVISETWVFNAGGYINDPRKLKFAMRIAKCLTMYHAKFHHYFNIEHLFLYFIMEGEISTFQMM